VLPFGVVRAPAAPQSIALGDAVKDLPADRARFGQFELDVRTGEPFAVDRTDGSARVLLREKPFPVLRMLIERGGKIVTRNEIRSRLWPNVPLLRNARPLAYQRAR